jgi:Carboxypeptidase regulatory-like domain
MSTLLVFTAFLLTQLSVAVPNGTVSGMLRDSTGKPAVATTVTLFSSAGSAMQAESTADGSFEFPKVPAGSYAMRAPGFSSVDVLVEGKSLSVNLAPLDFGRGFPVGGKVIDKSGRLEPGVTRTVTLSPVHSVTAGGIAGGTVSSFGGTLGNSFGGSLEAEVRADGSFEFPAVAEGPYTLRVAPYAAGAKSTRVDVTQETHNLEIVIPFQLEVAGRVLLEGRTLGPNTTMQAVQPTFTSATGVHDDGTFKLRLLEGENRISLARLPAEISVKKIMFGSTDITDKPLNIEATTSPLEIVVTLETVSPSVAGVQVLGRGSSRIEPAHLQVAGKVVVLNTQGEAFPIRPNVNLSFRVPDGSYSWTTVRADGTFKLPLLNNRYMITVGGLLPEYSVKSISSGSLDLLTDPLIVDGKGVPAEIVVILEYKPSVLP